MKLRIILLAIAALAVPAQAQKSISATPAGNNGTLLWPSDTLVFGSGQLIRLTGGTGPTTDAAGEFSFDTNAWATSFGAIQVFNGTANTYLLGAEASDTPLNGQVPTWNTGGTITWETPGAGSVLWNGVGDPDGNNSVTLGTNLTIFLSTLDNGIVWELSNTDADAAADTTLFKISHNDGGDANVIYLLMQGDKDGTPTSDFIFTQAGFTSLLPINPPAEAYDATGWNSDTGAPQKDAVRDVIVTLAPLASPTFTGIVTLPTESVMTVDDFTQGLTMTIGDDTAIGYYGVQGDTSGSVTFGSQVGTAFAGQHFAAFEAASTVFQVGPGGNITTAGALITGSGGSVAGYLQLGQGSAPSVGTTAVTLYAPAAVTSYKMRYPGAAGSGLLQWTNTAGDMVGTLSTLTSGRVTFATTNGLLADDADFTFATDTATITKIIGSTSITNSALTSGRLVFSGAAGIQSDDSDLTFATDTLTATKIVGSTSITDTGLTSTRVTFAGTAGLLSDDADMTFATDTLTVTKLGATILAGTATLAENSSIALDPAGSADGKYSGITVTGTGGATIAFGDLVTLDKDDSRWELVDVSVAAAATGDARGILGMAVTSSTDGTAITVLLQGIIRADANFPALTIGAAAYATTAGDITVTKPSTVDHVIRTVGFALTADEIYFNPEPGFITYQ